MTWSEEAIASALPRQTFNRKYLAVVPNCNWTGHECDLLAMTENLRVIDVEIKISRADLKADAKKEKWWRREYFGQWPSVSELRYSTLSHGLVEIRRDRRARYKSTPKDWPNKFWKHYYALPAEIWTDDLLDGQGSPASGVLLLTSDGRQMRARVRRLAIPNREAKPISSAAAVDIARLASLRMWDAYERLEHREGA